MNAYIVSSQTTGCYLVFSALRAKLTTELVHLIFGWCKGHISPGWANLLVPRTALVNNLHFRLWIRFLEWDNEQSIESISLRVYLQTTKPVEGGLVWVAGCANMSDNKVYESPLLISTKKIVGVEYGYVESVNSEVVLYPPIIDLWRTVASRLITM